MARKEFQDFTGKDNTVNRELPKNNEIKKEKRYFSGTIYNCDKVNCRKTPEYSLNNILQMMEKQETVRIDPDSSTEQFYKCFKDGKTFYIDKHFVKVKG